MQNYRFELITGPMSCGKTEELLRRLKRAVIAGKKIKVFSPEVDTRVVGNFIKSRNGLSQKAIKVSNSVDILDHISEQDEIIAIDELQFFEDDIVNVIKTLTKLGKKVIGTGLDLDFKEDAFGPMPLLLCFADKVDKLTAICMKCGSEYGTRTQRLINGEPADVSSPLIMIGGDETYEARCRNCYELKDKRKERPSIITSIFSKTKEKKAEDSKQEVVKNPSASNRPFLLK